MTERAKPLDALREREEERKIREERDRLDWVARGGAVDTLLGIIDELRAALAAPSCWRCGKEHHPDSSCPEVALCEKSSSGFALTVDSQTSVQDGQDAKTSDAKSSHGRLLPEWDQLTSDSQNKVRKWFDLAAERLQLILDAEAAPALTCYRCDENVDHSALRFHPKCLADYTEGWKRLAASGHGAPASLTRCSYCDVECTPNVRACAECAKKYLLPLGAPAPGLREAVLQEAEWFRDRAQMTVLSEGDWAWVDEHIVELRAALTAPVRSNGPAAEKTRKDFADHLSRGLIR